ncbi:MAG: ATP-binding protein [Clostridia bacterium]|nr:ATP-binding protein [Clostridia bacterium]
MENYLPRIADERLKKSLRASGAVLIEGPKWCGKTRTAMNQAHSVLMMQDPDKQSSYLQTASIKPSLLLEGETPRLLDEWQIAPILWDAVRFTVDQRQKTGQFILTGSAVPGDNLTSHTGTGRISRLRMRPMSLFESQDSAGIVSLAELFAGSEDLAGINPIAIEKLAELITRGGWPASVGEDQAITEQRARDYVDAVINLDVSRVDSIEKSPGKVRQLMRSLARNLSTEASMSTLKQDMEAADESITIPTISSYLNALERIFVVEDLAAWNPALRSKTPLRTSSKRHFADPSIATAVMGITAQRLLRDFNTFGYLFESLCIRDLRVYADSLDGNVFHYRDKTGLEADAVLVLRDGRWGAIEIKMGANEFDAAAANLKKFVTRVDTQKMQEPSFLMILTATEFAYRREDGIFVVPIGCLKP